MASSQQPSEKQATVYVQLLDEGTPTVWPTQAIDLGGGLYKLLPHAELRPRR